jgi:hypothetical protein
MSRAELARKGEAGSSGSSRALPQANSSDLQISKPDDPLECKADRVADAVTGGGRIANWSISRLWNAPTRGRKREELPVQHKAESNAAALEVPFEVDDVLHSLGNSLDCDMRRFMESRMWFDLSEVRIHTDARAAASAKEVGARADLKVVREGSRLDFGSTRVTTLSGLENAVHLTELFLFNTPLRDLESIRYMTKLQNLRLDNTLLDDLIALKKLRRLERLTLSGTAVSDLSALSELANPRELDLENSKASDLEALGGPEKLENLVLSGTTVRDLSPLKGLRNLNSLNVPNTPVNEEQNSELQTLLPELTVLSCSTPEGCLQ